MVMRLLNVKNSLFFPAYFNSRGNHLLTGRFVDRKRVKLRYGRKLHNSVFEECEKMVHTFWAEVEGFHSFHKHVACGLSIKQGTKYINLLCYSRKTAHSKLHAVEMCKGYSFQLL